MAFEFVAQHWHRPVAGRVTFEEPRHPMGALVVDDNRAHLAAFRSTPMDVEVAEGCHAGSATVHGLLAHALLCLGGEVPRVELGDRAHDAVKEHAARRLIDVLAAGHELCTGGSELDVDLDIIDAVARKAVNLVNDHVLDAVLGHERQHLLQLRTVGGSGTFSGVDELGDDDRTECLCSAQASVALGRNGEALGLAALGRLLFGTDAQIDDRHGLDTECFRRVHHALLVV
ncbi:hypothetical protein RB608_18230 [Nocardioides sp. LHD-245]|nr:hypothetical protein [Nocardioides sp. LHD-245]